MKRETAPIDPEAFWSADQRKRDLRKKDRQRPKHGQAQGIPLCRRPGVTGVVTAHVSVRAWATLLFPEPLGPTRAHRSPLWTVRSRPSIKVAPPTSWRGHLQSRSQYQPCGSCCRRASKCCLRRVADGGPLAQALFSSLHLTGIRRRHLGTAACSNSRRPRSQDGASVLRSMEPAELAKLRCRP